MPPGPFNAALRTRPVTSIRRPSCFLMSLRTSFGPLRRKRRPGAMSTCVGSCSGVDATMNARPLAQPGMATRAESPGTGRSWAAIAPARHITPAAETKSLRIVGPSGAGSPSLPQPAISGSAALDDDEADVVGGRTEGDQVGLDRLEHLARGAPLGLANHRFEPPGEVFLVPAHVLGD